MKQLKLSWQSEALCRGVDPDLWFPIGDEGGYARRYNPVALAMCQSCPVKRQCLSYALDIGATYGIWGGTTPNQREAMRRARQGRDGNA